MLSSAKRTRTERHVLSASLFIDPCPKAYIHWRDSIICGTAIYCSQIATHPLNLGVFLSSCPLMHVAILQMNTPSQGHHAWVWKMNATYSMKTFYLAWSPDWVQPQLAHAPYHCWDLLASSTSQPKALGSPRLKTWADIFYEPPQATAPQMTCLQHGDETHPLLPTLLSCTT